MHFTKPKLELFIYVVKYVLPFRILNFGKKNASLLWNMQYNCTLNYANVTLLLKKLVIVFSKCTYFINLCNSTALYDPHSMNNFQ